MVRVKSMNSIVKKKKIFELAKGFRGRAKNCYSIATRRVFKALQHAYVSRRLKKRDFRKLFVTRVGIACRANGIAYNQFMHGLVLADIRLNRKILSQLAIHEPATFRSLTLLAMAHAKEHKKGLALAKQQESKNPHIIHRSIVM
eukprot:CFRG6639T1